MRTAFSSSHRPDMNEILYFKIHVKSQVIHPAIRRGSGGAKVLGKLSVPGRPLILIIVEQGPIALAEGAGGDCLDIFTLVCFFFLFSFYIPLWKTARYRLKFCLKGPLNPKQPTNHPAII